ncbi:lysylphosphatidylglycerol synthase domain-containing protein [Algibacter mikhailovii]|uniref:lysylphosphatidylglycerol synthase domain-containing protein n=1 Tax=Algibacter mikhailovii TaxID=425498 RepID=UPI00249430CB|nr:lysylphosphatidylglycerol synthase domain-containing protein [Algibacter mikhailovii]
MTALIKSYKTNQLFFILIKLSIVIASFAFIYFKIAGLEKITYTDFFNIISSKNILSIQNILVLLVLTCLNWSLETLKWQSLVHPIKKIDFKAALAQSLGSLTASLFTPNRIGEYGAKALYFQPNLRKSILLINFLSNLLQLSITICLGGVGLSYLWLNFNQLALDYNNLLVYALFIIVILITLFVILNNSKYTIAGLSIPKLKQRISSYPKRLLTKGLLYSFCRYLIFSFQFYFSLQLFQVNINYFDAMSVIMSMYLIVSVLPSIFIFDVVIKGSVSVYLFSFLDVNELSVLCITTLMWLLNFVFPSLIGSYFVLSFKPVKSAAL